MGRPATLWLTFGKADRIRVPLPAASTIAIVTLAPISRNPTRIHRPWPAVNQTGTFGDCAGMAIGAGQFRDVIPRHVDEPTRRQPTLPQSTDWRSSRAFRLTV